jgi:hypothetical protein
VDIFEELTPGNILVAHSPVGSGANALLQEYDPSKPAGQQLVRSIRLPDFSGGFADVRDLVVDRQGNIRIFNGTFEPRLTTYDPEASVLTHATFANWNTLNNATYGGLAAWRNFVYATDQEIPGDDPLRHEGIVRFDIETGEMRRFVNDGQFIDLAVGLDGRLYALGPAGLANSRFIRVFDPLTMLPAKPDITGLPADTRALTVDANGQIYAVNFRDPNVYRYTAGGTPLPRFNTGLGGEADFSDIDLNENGRDLLIANINFSNTSAPGDGDVVLTTVFGGPTRILQAPDASSDMKFAAWVQAPVGSINGPLFVDVAASTQPSHGSVVIQPDGSFDYLPDQDYSGTDSFFYVVSDQDGNRNGATVTMDIAALNDQPVLTAAAPTAITDEDDALTIPLVALINGGPGTTTITDADVDQTRGGIAVTGTSGLGVWSYSVDGILYDDIGVVSDTNALLLPYYADIRFTPSGGGGGTASFSYRAWDKTAGRSLAKYSTTYEVCPFGGVPDEDGLCPDANGDPGEPPDVFVYGSYSEDTDTLTVTLADLNDAPVIIPASPVMGSTDEDQDEFSTEINAFLKNLSDPDGNSGLLGIAITAATGNGQWRYSHAGGPFLPLPEVAEDSALLLERHDLLKYLPDQQNGEVPTVTYRAWDRTDGSQLGTLVDAGDNGGISAFSAASDTAALWVVDVNDAPVLTPVSPLIGTTDAATQITKRLDQFVSGIDDVDRGATVGGVAITAATGVGTWKYSTDGVVFQPFPTSLGVNSALLLHRNDLIRYTPVIGGPETATLTYRAWDATSGVAGKTASVIDSGDDSPFSLAGDTATLTVKEVNDPPVIGGLLPSLTYVENDPPKPVFPNLTITDPDSSDFAGGSLTVSIVAGGSPHDRLSIEEIGGITIAGDTLFYDTGQPNLLGSFTVNGWVVTVHFTTPDATPAAVQAVARAIAYENVSEKPTSKDRRVHLTVTDGDGGNDTASVIQTVRMQPVNDPPMGVVDTYPVFAGGSLKVNVLQGVLKNDSDAEGDQILAVLDDTVDHGTLSFKTDGSFTYTPHRFYHGVDVFSYRASDGKAQSSPVSVNLNVLVPKTNPAHPADANGDGYLSAQDPTLIVNYMAAHLNPVLPPSYSPPPMLDYNGDGSVTQTDVDGTTAAINAGGPRQLPAPRLEVLQNPPVLGPGKFVSIALKTTAADGTPLASVNAGESFYLEAWVADLRLADQLGVAAAYLDVTYPSDLVTPTGSLTKGGDFPHFATGRSATAGVIDEAGSGRTAVLPGGDEHLLWRIAFTSKSRGEAVFSGDPADVLPAGQVLLFGIDGPVPVENVDYVGTSITVKGPPIAEDDDYPVAEDGQVFVPAKGVLENDRDEEDDPLEALWVEGPTHAKEFALNEDGSFYYEPEDDFFGTDSFTYVASDGVFESLPATVTLDVIGSNDDPVAMDDAYNVFRNGSLTVSVFDGVLHNDRDADEDLLKAILEDPPEHGDLIWSVNNNGSFVYTPDEDYGGPDRFTYRAFDGQAYSDVATVDVTVFYDWTNPKYPVDVNADGYRSPLDSLLVFNDLQRSGGTHLLPNPPVPPYVAPPFLDVNDDGLASFFDAWSILDELNIHGSGPLDDPLILGQPPVELGDDPLVEFRLATTTLQGQPTTGFSVGETFLLKVYASDLRMNGAGLFSAYLDVLFDQDFLELAGPVEFGTTFADVQAGMTDQGFLDEYGAVQAEPPPGNPEVLVFQVPLVATSEGNVEIRSEPADVVPASDVTLLGIDGAISVENIEYGAVNVSLVLTDTDGDGVADFEENAAPNSGDGDDDGTQDRLQSNVASLRNPDVGIFVTFQAPSQVPLANVEAVANPSPGNAPQDVAFPAGFFQFDIPGITPGGSTVVTIHLQPGTQANTYYRFGPTPDNATLHWYPFMFDGTTGAMVYADRLEVHFVAGERGDDEPAVAGVTAGPGAPGVSATPWQNPVRAEDVNNDDDVTPVDVLLVITAINDGRQGPLPQFPDDDATIPPYLDTNGDNQLTPLDVLTIITLLNEPDGGGEGESARAEGGLPSSVSVQGSGSPEEITPRVGDFLTLSLAQASAEREPYAPTRTPAARLDPASVDHVLGTPTTDAVAPRSSRLPRLQTPTELSSATERPVRDFEALEDAVTDIAAQVSLQWKPSRIR